MILNGQRFRALLVTLSLILVTVSFFAVRDSGRPETAEIDLVFLQVKFPKVPVASLEKAISGATARGWHPTQTVDRFAVGNANSKVVRVQDGTFSNSVGEVVVWDWNDNDPDTMEGLIFVENYGTGEWVFFEAIYDVTDEYDIFTIGGDLIDAYAGDGEGSYGTYGIVSTGPLGRKPSVVKVNASFAPEYCCISKAGLTTAQAACFNEEAMADTFHDSWLAAGINGAIGAVIGGIKGTAGGFVTSLAGAVTGGLAGASTGVAGQVIMNIWNGSLNQCGAEDVVSNIVAENCEGATDVIWGWSGIMPQACEGAPFVM
jgi:hypothetical protein